jgi:FixJ family two-component response regulator
MISKPGSGPQSKAKAIQRRTGGRFPPPRINAVPVVPVISIIDDDPSVRAATHNLVRSFGYVVHTFDSAEAFLQSPQLAETSCAIVDVRMPTMSGLDMQAHLRAQGNSVPLIFITAVPDTRARTRAFAAGASGFLTKPFDKNALIGCIDTALGR